MASIITCRSCGKKLQIAEEHMGLTVKCPACEVTFTAEPDRPVPSGVEDSAAAFQEQVPPERRPPRSADLRDFDDDYDYREDRRDWLRRAEEAVRGPATALLIVAILGLVCGPASFALSGLGGAGLFDDGQMGQANGGEEAFLHALSMFSVAMGTAASVFLLICALKMQKLQSHGLAIAGSIVAMIPAVSPCCLLGLPFGIWALSVLNRDYVKQAFE